MGRIKLLVGFGFVLCYMLLSPASVSAQHHTVSELKRQQQAPPSTTVVYVFCKSWQKSAGGTSIYYSTVFATDLRDPMLAHQAFLQFVEQKYAYKSKGSLNADVSCTDPATQAQTNTSQQTDMDRSRHPGMILVETGWKYSAAGSAGAASQPPAGAAPAPAAAAPKSIQLGQTTDEVLGALGKPDKIINLGAKQIYVYKDLKVTFMNGKVAGVQ